MRFFTVLLLLVPLFAAVFDSLAQSPASPSRLGVLTDLSGPNAPVGAQTVLGLQMAQEAARTRGDEFEFIVEDTASDAMKAVSAVQKLLLLDQVDALYVDTSPIALAVSPLSIHRKKVLVYLGGATSILAANPFALKSFLDFEAAGRKIAQYLRSRGHLRTGMILVQIEASERAAAGFKSVYPDAMMATHNSPIDDVSTLLLQMKKRQVQALISLSYEAGLLNLLKAVSLLHYDGLVGTLSTNVSDRVPLQYPKLMLNLVIVGMRPVGEEFRSRWKARASSSSDSYIQFAALAELHATQILGAIRACGKTDMSCQVGRVNSSPPDSALGFRGFHDRVAQFELSMFGWKDGSFGEIN